MARHTPTSDAHSTPGSASAAKPRDLSWASKSSLAIGVAIPLGIIALANPAAATPDAKSGEIESKTTTADKNPADNSPADNPDPGGAANFAGSLNYGQGTTAASNDITDRGYSLAAASGPDNYVEAEPRSRDSKPSDSKPRTTPQLASSERQNDGANGSDKVWGVNRRGPGKQTDAQIAEEVAKSGGWEDLGHPTSRTVLNADLSTTTYRDYFDPTGPPSLPLRSQTITVNGPEIISEIDLYRPGFESSRKIVNYVDGTTSSTKTATVTTSQNRTAIGLSTADEEKVTALSIIERPGLPPEIVSGEAFIDGLTVANITLPTEESSKESGLTEQSLGYAGQSDQPAQVYYSETGTPSSAAEFWFNADVAGFAVTRGKADNPDFGEVYEELIETPRGTDLGRHSIPGIMALIVIKDAAGNQTGAEAVRSAGTSGTFSLEPDTLQDGNIGTGTSWNSNKYSPTTYDYHVSLTPADVKTEDRFEVTAFPPRQLSTIREIPGRTAVVDLVITDQPGFESSVTGGAVEYVTDGSIVVRRVGGPSPLLIR